jgi:hypothetical protein
MIVNITEKIRTISPAIDDTSLIPLFVNLVIGKLFSMQMKHIFYEPKINTHKDQKRHFLVFWWFQRLFFVIIIINVDTSRNGRITSVENSGISSTSSESIGYACLFGATGY